MYHLNDSTIKALKPKESDYTKRDGGGLFLFVSKAGGKLWRMRYRLNGKGHILALGKYPVVSLADARTKTIEAHKLIEQGTHPLDHKKKLEQEKTDRNKNSFGAVARAWIEANKANWSAYYLKQIEALMERYVFSSKQLDSKPISEVGASDIRAICLAVAKRDKLKEGERKNGSIIMAKNLLQWCGAIFCYAIAHSKADIDPTYGLRGLPELKRPPVKHNRPLSRDELKELISALDNYSGQRATVIAVWLLLLTFVRTGELRKSTWSEFDIEGKTWRIPPERMKKRKEHWVPLSDQALALLKELREISGYGTWLFPNNRRSDDCMTATTINRALENMGFNGKGTIGFAAHGFRGTASTMLHELNFRPDLIEHQLSHAEANKVKASYNHAQYLPERTAMMQHWADYIYSLKQSANLTPINQKRA